MKWKRYPSYIDSGVELLGSIPSHWRAHKLKHLADVRLSNIDKLSVDDQTVVRLANYVDVYKNERITADMDLMIATASDDQIERLSLAVQDVLITKDSESPDDIAVPAYVSEAMEGVVCGYHLALLRPDTDTLQGGFLYRWLQGKVSQAYFTSHANGMTRYGIGKGDIGDAPLLWAPLEEQKTIADFLDRETTKIDTLIAEQRNLIERLREKRAGLVSKFITKGLDENAATKPSNDFWLGDVPAHWTVCPLRYRYTVELGKMLDQRRVTGQQLAPYLRNTDVQWDSINVLDLPEMDFDGEDRVRYQLQKGDLIVCEGGEVGRAAIWNGELEECYYQKALHRIRPRDTSKDDPRFLFYALMDAASRGRFTAGAEKATIAHLPADTLRRYLFTFPNIQEQQAIVAHLENELGLLASLLAEAGTSIALLQEHRSALITAVVTGNVDVRGLVTGASA